MRERLYVPWGEDEDGPTAMDIKMLAMDVYPHVGMTADAFEEALYRWIGWLYETREGREAARG